MTATPGASLSSLLAKEAVDIGMEELSVFAAYLDAFMPAWRDVLPPLPPVAPGVVVINARAVRSRLHDIAADPTVGARLRALTEDHRAAAAAAAERARQADELAKASAPVVLVAPKALAPISFGQSAGEASDFDGAAKVRQFDAIVSANPWIPGRLRRQDLYEAALRAEIFLETLRRVSGPVRARDASVLAGQCENYLIERGFGSRRVPVGSLVLAALALGITVEHKELAQCKLLLAG